jgi:UDP-N-acetylglucosamine 2-epimerase (non-hydrolysing)
VTAEPPRPIAVLFGTRPEAIKLAPVIRALQERDARPLVISTGQHRELVEDILGVFDVEVDEDLDLMRPEQTLDYVLSTALTGIGEAIDRHGPAVMVVQGDTTSALAASLAAFHRHVPLAHVEAGLRSRRLDLPFPEELNRRVTSLIARWHFAPTEGAAENLRREDVEGEIVVTGNTVVDALQHIVATRPEIPQRVAAFVDDRPFVLATAHRRESWGGGIASITRALSDVLAAEAQMRLVFVTHPNPVARGPVEEILGSQPRALVLDALDYPAFVELLRRATVVVSDSGGVQEEGPTLGVPVLVTRAVTERPEGVEAGAVRVVGMDPTTVREATLELLRSPATRDAMANAGRHVYGDGQSAHRIADVLLRDAAC